MSDSEPSGGNKASKRTRGRATSTATPGTGPRKRATQRYSTADKLRAVTAMLTVNVDHPYSNASMQAAREVLNAPHLNNETLFNWMHEYRSQVTALMQAAPTPAQIVVEVQDLTLKNMVKVRDLALEKLVEGKKLDEASAYHLSLIMGIHQDHIHKMHKVSPERMNKVYAVIDACQRNNVDFDVLLDDMLRAVQIEAVPQQKIINTHSVDNGTDKP